MFDPNSDYARHAKEWWDSEKAKQKKAGRPEGKKKSNGRWGRIYPKVIEQLGMRKYIDKAITPTADEVALVILRGKGIYDGVRDKLEAKQIIMAYAVEVGIAGANILGSPPRHRAAKPIKAKASPRPTVSSQDFYWSDEWRRVRYLALRAGRGVCELCGNGPTKGHPLHVDHIKPRSKYPELELTLSNLQVMCEDCNLGKSNIDEIDWRKKAK